MISFTLGIIIGIALGWVFLKRPEWADTLVEKLKDKFGV